ATVVEGEPRGRALHLNRVEVAPVRVEDLYALEVGDVYAPLVVDGYRAGRAELSGLVAVRAELREEAAIGRELEDGVVECAEPVDVAEPVNGDSNLKLQAVGLPAHRLQYDL